MQSQGRASRLKYVGVDNRVFIYNNVEEKSHITFQSVSSNQAHSANLAGGNITQLEEEEARTFPLVYARFDSRLTYSGV
jgi:hypothetical protein